MPGRKIPLVSNYIYHVFNRGVNKQVTFFNRSDYIRFTDLIDYYRFLIPPLSYSELILLSEKDQARIKNELRKNPLNVQIISFILMPNHFHFTLKQISNHGISKFIANVINSYTKYINIKYDRTGPLFQGRFKAVLVKTEKQLLHLTRYHHLNIYIDRIVNEIDDILLYEFSSLPNYLGNDLYQFIDTKLVLNQFRSISSYKRFVLSNRDYQRSISQIKHILLDK